MPQATTETVIVREGLTCHFEDGNQGLVAVVSMSGKETRWKLEVAGHESQNQSTHKPVMLENGCLIKRDFPADISWPFKDAARQIAARASIADPRFPNIPILAPSRCKKMGLRAQRLS